MNNNEQETYGFLLDSLENEVNTRETDLIKVKDCVLKLNSVYGVEISREFLRNMIKGTDKQVSNKLYYALKSLGFNKLGFHYSHSLDFVKSQVEIVEYSCLNGIITSKTNTITIGKEIPRNSRQVFHFLE